DDFIAFLARPNSLSRVPDRNKTVKKQAVGAKFVNDVAAGVRQAERAGDGFGHAPRKQETATVLFLPLDDLELVVDALGRQPVDRLGLAGDRVELVLARSLAAGQDRADAQCQPLLVRHLASRGEPADERVTAVEE